MEGLAAPDESGKGILNLTISPHGPRVAVPSTERQPVKAVVRRDDQVGRW